MNNFYHWLGSQGLSVNPNLITQPQATKIVTLIKETFAVNLEKILMNKFNA